ncbi:MAG: bifunctional riboflavin kinase/FAD synthetase [Chloroflexi bacterium]|nr:bifunctional riboflavin kinase/FAD synthetase [Chloroflexota bacterium]
MQIEEELAQVPAERETLLTIGVFDGIHLGHCHLLGQLVANASAAGLLSGVITFNRHPQTVLQPQTTVTSLITLEERVSLIKSLGVDLVRVLTFTPELAGLEARQFVLLLMKHLKMRGLVVGPDFALGQKRQGTVASLRRLGQELGFSVDVVLPISVNGDLVSSTVIRNYVALGDMKRVQRLLGRPFHLEAEVVAGDERGRTLGFPTANLDVDQRQALPKDGVYAARVRFNSKVHPAVLNIGLRPTFGGQRRVVEVHVLDFHGDLYHKRLKVEMVDRLREELQFTTADELKTQIARDVERTLALLGS